MEVIAIVTASHWAKPQQQIAAFKTWQAANERAAEWLNEMRKEKGLCPVSPACVSDGILELQDIVGAQYCNVTVRYVPLMEF